MVWWKIGLAAAYGALVNVMVFLWEIEYPWMSLLTAAGMTRIGYKKKSFGQTVVCTLLLFFLAFSMEGAVCWADSYMGAVFVPLLAYLAGKKKRLQESVYEVTLHFKGNTKEIKGFLDTGNRLLEPMTGKMVHIASYEDVKGLLPEPYRQVAEIYFQTGVFESTKVTELQMYEFTFLSYHSIGNETGQLLGIRMDRACFYGRFGKKTEEKAVIGLTDQKLFVRERGRMIINGRLEL